MARRRDANILKNIPDCMTFNFTRSVNTQGHECYRFTLEAGRVKEMRINRSINAANYLKVYAEGLRLLFDQGVINTATRRSCAKYPPTTESILENAMFYAKKKGYSIKKSDLRKIFNRKR